jgi:nucleotide-binding universal stress UspA family protein
MKILIATDGSKYSEKAIQMVKHFALDDNSEVKIISVVDMTLPLGVDIYTGGYMPSTIEIEKNIREHSANVLKEAKVKINEIFANIKITTDVLVGSPESRIVETAEEMKADLIIVGSHGYNSWERLLLGSVSDSVVHHAPCSVLIVRT